jgi:predicted AlkP superfamily pyrophosphatase or phosphodiesterase
MLMWTLAGCRPEAAAPTGSQAPGQATTKRPRLAVVLVVDQMRADYLERYADLYRGGLARLRREGAWFVEADVAHALTYTAPGHASVATGTHPAHHGVVANEWYDRTRAGAVYAADDPEATPALTAEPKVAISGRSPRQLERSALGDWLKGQEPKARVFSVALKDRAAIMMGGQAPDRAFWYVPEVAGFGSSSFYAGGSPPPAWVAEFNAGEPVFKRFAAGWTRMLDASAYLRSGPDRVDAEADGVKTEFPHVFDDGKPDARERFAKQIFWTPFGDEMSLQFARTLIAEEQLGADEVPDVLLLSLSSADYVGHAYGPFSHEIQDYYVRLDAYLGEFLAQLDEAVGPDGYVLALTADHGALPLPEEARLRGHPTARRVVSKDYRPAVRGAVHAVLGELQLPPETLLHVGEDGLWLDVSRASGDLTPARLRAAVAVAVRKLEFVADTYTAEELSGPGDARRPFLTNYRRSYYAPRSPDVQLRFKEWSLVDAQPGGTSHGSPYRYDTHVPVLFFGAGVKPGVHSGAAETVDVAPTLAALLGVKPPADIDGRSLAALVLGR